MSLLVLLGSPRREGVSATLAQFFINGFLSAGGNAEICFLEDYRIIPCKACNSCFYSPHICRLKEKDDVNLIFKKMKSAQLVLIASPIFFYGVPARLKALIDRGQLLYAKSQTKRDQVLLPRAIAILCAGRKKGKMLFAGATLTLKWFFRSANSHLKEIMAFKSLEDKSCISKEHAIVLWLSGFLNGLECRDKNFFLPS